MKDRYVYFIYSAEQRSLRSQVELNIGKKYTPGKVLSNGKWSNFTEISSSPNSRHSDAIIVAEGYLGTFRYSDSTSV